MELNKIELWEEVYNNKKARLDEIKNDPLIIEYLRLLKEVSFLEEEIQKEKAVSSLRK